MADFGHHPAMATRKWYSPGGSTRGNILGALVVLLMVTASPGIARGGEIAQKEVLTRKEDIPSKEGVFPQEGSVQQKGIVRRTERLRKNGDGAASSLTGMVDRAQESVSSGVIGLSRVTDRLLGTRAEYGDEAYDSILRMHMAYNHDALGNHYGMTLEGDLSLPGTEERVELVFESDNPDDPADRDRELRGEGTDVRQYLGLRFLNPFRFVKTETSFRIPGRLPMELRSQLRAWQDFQPGTWHLRPRVTVFDASATGTGYTMDLSLRRPVGNDMQFQSSTAATWFRREAQYYYDQTLSLIQPLGRRREIVWQIGAAGESEPEDRLTLYYAQFSWRRVVYRDWLLLEVRPQARRAIEDGFIPEFRFYLGLDLLFGHHTAY